MKWFSTIQAAMAAALLLAAGCASLPVPPGPAQTALAVTGTARYAGKPLPGALVAARPLSAPGQSVFSTTDAEGRFTLALPPGSWLVTARGRGAGDSPLFAYWGGNPLHLYGPYQEDLNLLLLSDPGPPERTRGEGIEGRVLADGVPVPEAVVSVYLSSEEGFRGPPYLSAPPTASDGSFHLYLPPGTYHLLARRRASGEAGEGPLRKGDLLGYFPGNPVTLREGEGLFLILVLGEVKRPREGGSLSPGSPIVLTGRITDEAGRPVPGARALLYAVPEMAGRPAFVSGPADEQGVFRLETSREGRFFLAARKRIGAPLESGDLNGSYDGSDDHSLLLKWGQRIEGIELRMEPMP